MTQISFSDQKLEARGFCLDFNNRQGKWCLAELVTARFRGISTVMVKLPDFFLPTEEHIQSFEKTVPDILDLQAFGIGMADVTGTLRWLRAVSTLSLSQRLEEMDEILDHLRLTKGKANASNDSAPKLTDSDRVILADQDPQPVLTLPVEGINRELIFEP